MPDQHFKHLITLVFLALSFGGCTKFVQPPAKPSMPLTQYSALIYDAQSQQRLTVTELADRLRHDDVVVVGEYHGHHASHLLQSSLQILLHQRNSDQVLSMEQFEIDRQPALDRYLEGSLGEAEMIEDADAWSNYRASYRPLIEFARQHDLPVVAANAPGHIVRCVGRRGVDYLDSLDKEQRAALPDAPFTQTDAYREKFFAALGHGHVQHGDPETLSERLRNSYQAQLLRDNTMAAQIIESMNRHPESQVLHLTGTFHSEGRLGTVAVLEERRPELDVAVISPVQVSADTAPEQALQNHQDKGDYLYLVQPLPTEYRDGERQRAAMMKQFGDAAKNTCD